METVPIVPIKFLTLDFDPNVINTEPLFLFSRFEVRTIKVRRGGNGLSQNHVHGYLVTGEKTEKLILCLMENAQGNISLIKAFRGKLFDDTELAGYVINGVSQILGKDWKFKIKPVHFNTSHRCSGIPF